MIDLLPYVLMALGSVVMVVFLFAQGARARRKTEAVRNPVYSGLTETDKRENREEFAREVTGQGGGGDVGYVVLALIGAGVVVGVFVSPWGWGLGVLGVFVFVCAMVVDTARKPG